MSNGIRAVNERRKWRGMESNHRPQGYDPCELPTAPPRDFQGLQRHDCFTSFCIHPYAYVLCGSGPGLRRPQSVRQADFHRHSRKDFAEEEGFEPPIRLDVCHVSNVVLSATQPFFRFAALFSAVTGLCLSPSVLSSYEQKKFRHTILYIDYGSICFTFSYRFTVALSLVERYPL